ncbi:hypothetical protein A3709_02300 [Halioglobus sp. HI00S01]|uniref:DUF547 domain-containing protein n=1 Tax=Halioglobus sp. HI00S01 TaxID=1822214 RepID=UPI0007C3D45D|nr:DUF547 domain-containing protein [Halioglobus sp. HI00S01]KZX58316.1 hypothetical protein A3709_02300 [Halioglobus sp. HI00S01]
MSKICLKKIAARLILVLFVLPYSALAQLDVGSWNELLGEAVNNGYVRYSQWDNNARFDALVEEIAAADVSEMTRDEKLVFYINTYNILAARGILDGRSPATLWGRYLYFKRDKYTVAGEPLSLHALEHDRILPLGEPRIHFAIVCASMSCPILQSEAYTVQALDQQLDSAARQFINDEARNKFWPDEGRAELSSIFKWFEEDFVTAAGSVQAYVASYVEGDFAPLLREKKLKVEYLDYDWSLNGEL